MSSKYLLGKGAFWQVSYDDGLRAAAVIALEVSSEARRDGLYVEAQFPNPGPGGPIRDGEQVKPGGAVQLRGPLLPGYQCGVRYLTQPTVLAPELCDLADGE